MKWQYHRMTGGSKWTTACDCWVTHWDGESNMHIGVFGRYMGEFPCTRKQAREAVVRYSDAGSPCRPGDFAEYLATFTQTHGDSDE